MSAVLPIYSTQAAPAPLAGWLRRVLEPVVAACRFARAAPVEVRPTGAWSGWCAGRDEAPDRRIAISQKICFWTPESLIAVYLHECGHRSLQPFEVADHGPQFFCLNAILLLRSAAFFRLDPLFKLALYDLQDCPAELETVSNWRGEVLGWALPLAAELAATDESAEALAAQVCESWKSFIRGREQSRAQIAQQALAARKFAASHKEKNEHLQYSLFVARVFLVASLISLFSVVYFVFF